MSAVLSWLLIGDKAAAKDRELLRRRQVLYVLNATPPKTDGGVLNFFEKEPNLEYLRLSIRDVATDSILPHVPAAVEFLQRIRIRADGRVLVHCNEGKSRSAAIVAAFLVKAYGKSPNEALDAMRAARPEAEPREAFIRQLGTLEPANLDAVVDGFADGSTAASGPSIGPAVGPRAPPWAATEARAEERAPSEPAALSAKRPQVGPTMMPPLAKRPSLGQSIASAGVLPAPRHAVGPVPSAGPSPSVGPSPRPAVGPAPRPAVGPERRPPAGASWSCGE